MAQSPIKTLDIDITEKCPLACHYCYKHKQARTMDRDLAFHAVDWLIARSGDLEKVAVNFVGGEPMAVFPLLREVADYGLKQAEKAGKKITFGGPISNSVMSDEIIEFMRMRNYPLVLSIDGKAETQDLHRTFANGRGSSEVVFPNVKEVVAAFPNALGRMTVAPETAALIGENVGGGRGLVLRLHLRPLGALCFRRTRGRSESGIAVEYSFSFTTWPWYGRPRSWPWYGRPRSLPRG